MVVAREDADNAWAILSLIVALPRAVPHKKIPSVAKSEGLSFTCASKKNFSLFTGTFSILANSSFSSPFETIPALKAIRSVSIEIVPNFGVTILTVRRLPFLMIAGGFS